MADKSIIEQMLERLVNEDQAGAEELFHEYVVTKSRDIYESLIESEISEESAEEEDDEEEEAVEEATEEDDEETVEENFGEFDVLEADPTDDLETDMEVDGEEEAGDEFGSEEGEQSEEEVMQDIESIIDELQAKFDELKGEEEEQGEFGDEEGEEEPGEAEEEVVDSFDTELATVREYVEKITGGHGAEKKGSGESNVNAKSIVASKNDMGGTAANIAKSGTEAGVEANKGQLKGNGLLKGTPKEDNAGNINVPGGKAGGAFSTKEPGHGAEKKGAGESADNKQSLFRK